jgi:hypothetical protein
MNYLLLIKVQADDTNLSTVRWSTRSWLLMPEFEDWGKESLQQNRKVIPDFRSWLLADVRGTGLYSRTLQFTRHSRAG